MKLLTIEQAAERLAVSTTTIRSMLEQLGAVDLAHGKAKKRIIRIPEASMDKYIRECAICGQTKQPVAAKAWHIERRRA